MQKLAWITDSTCGLSNEFIRENNIHVLPLSVIVNDVSYKEDYEFTRNTFYKLLQEHGEGATTSQPASGKFINLYNRSEEHTSELQSRGHLECRLLLEKK